MSRLKGFKDLIQDGVDQGATAVQEIHEAVASRPFDVLEKIPPIALPAKGVRTVHDAIVGGVYDMIRLVNKASGAVADQVIEVVEAPVQDRPCPPSSPADSDEQR